MLYDLIAGLQVRPSLRLSVARPLTPTSDAILAIETRSKPGPIEPAGEAEQVTMSIVVRAHRKIVRLPADEYGDPAALEQSILDAAYRLGAWDVARFVRGPLPEGSVPGDPGHGLTHHFDGSAYVINGDPGSSGDSGADMIAVAAKCGWAVWHTKLSAFGDPDWDAILRHRRSEDSSLQEDGTRDGWIRIRRQPMPIPRPGACHQHVYRLGRSHSAQVRGVEIETEHGPALVVESASLGRVRRGETIEWIGGETVRRWAVRWVGKEYEDEGRRLIRLYGAEVYE